MKNTLTIVVGTCNAYNSIWKNFDILLKRYWKLDCDIIVIGETIPMLGNDYINVLPGMLPWGERMLYGINQIKTEYTCFILDDYYMTTEIDTSFMEMHINLMNQYSADKIMFEIVADWVEYKLTHMEKSLYKLDSDSLYLNSVQPSIWKTEFLKKVMKPEYSPWDFELKGNAYTAKLNPTILLNAVPERIYFNYMRSGFKKENGWEILFKKENLDVTF
jgi:hypothetical protein